MANPFLLVGLGNPGARYQHTRHNIGFGVVDAFAHAHQFPEFHPEKKQSSILSKGSYQGTEVICCKPDTYMNRAGSAVNAVAAYYQIAPSRICVVHDDIDLAVGRVVVSYARGAGGHKGVDSIIASLGTNEFARIRLGIQPAAGKPEHAESFVLKPFPAPERATAEDAIATAVSAIETLFDHGIASAMNAFN